MRTLVGRRLGMSRLNAARTGSRRGPNGVLACIGNYLTPCTASCRMTIIPRALRCQLWGRLASCGRLSIGLARLQGNTAAVANRRARCHPAPHDLDNRQYFGRTTPAHQSPQRLHAAYGPNVATAGRLVRVTVDSNSRGIRCGTFAAIVPMPHTGVPLTISAPSLRFGAASL